VPFSLNSTFKGMSGLYDYLLLGIVDLFGNRSWHQRSTSTLGASEYAWNMLSMDKQMCSSWRMGQFAVKWIGITQEGPKYKVTLQLRWMPKSSPLPRSRDIFLEKGEGQHMLDELTTWHGDPLGFPFHVCMDSIEDAEKMKDMVDLQWYLIVAAVLAGSS
jgi:hypothetical protein